MGDKGIMILSNGLEILEIPDYSHLEDEVKQRWTALIEVLRSGRYKQTTAALRRGDSFCVLGVACDLVKDKESNWVDLPGKGIYGFTKGMELRSQLLPWEVKDLYSMGSFGFHCLVPNPQDPSNPVGKGLAGLNDKGVTFLELANVLETALNGGYIKT